MKRHTAICCCLFFASVAVAAVGGASRDRTFAWGGSRDGSNWFQVWIRDGYVRVEHTRSYNPLAIEHLRRTFPEYLDSPEFREPIESTGLAASMVNSVFICRTYQGLSNLRILEAPTPVHDLYIRFPLWGVATLLAAYPVFALTVLSKRRRGRSQPNDCSRCGYPSIAPTTVRCPACRNPLTERCELST